MADRPHDDDPTIAPGDADATIGPDDPDATVVPGDVDATIAASDPDATVAPTDPDATVVAPDPDATIAGGQPSDLADALPERFGNYDVVRELGRGGMGVVYVARDRSLDREVALKVLPSRVAANAETFRLFQSEAKLLATLHHPNVATIHSLEEVSGVHFLTMELIPGQELSERFSVPVTVDEVLRFGRQIAAALEAAHRMGVVHRDLKPDNVMVLPNRRLKVLDFGLALALGGTTDETGHVRTGAVAPEQIAGTPGYLSPEQIRRQPVDHRADIWAFGCILYEGLAGKRAFTGDDLHARLTATLKAPVDWDALPDTLSAPIRALVESCLTREPDERLDSITKARQIIEDEIARRALPTLEERRPDEVPNNLPESVTSLIGREDARRKLMEMAETTRLVTLTGVGGGGKTTLAIDVGRDLLAASPDGVWLVALAPLSDGALIPQSIATALGVRDQPGRSIEETLLAHLRDRELLLLLDNCEHLVETLGPFVNAMVRGCPSVRVIATSREALGVPGEVLFQLPPLAVPEEREVAVGAADLAANPSVALFVERARAQSEGFELDDTNAPAIGEICRKVDGIPLAIELAAAQIATMSPAAIARAIASQLDVTAAAAAGPAHHQTLRALIDWSYDQLEEIDRTLLRRLSMFRGGWSLDAAETICTGDGIDDWEILDALSALVDKSLIDQDREGARRTGVARYSILQTVRSYSEEKLEAAAELPALRQNHLTYFVDFAERGDEQLTGPAQAEWIERMAVDHNNLRRAFDSSLSTDAEANDRYRIAASLGRFWLMRGQWTEGRTRYERLFDETAGAPSAAHAKSLNWAGNLAKVQGDAPTARRLLERAVSMAEEIDEKAVIAASVNTLAHIARDGGDLPLAHSLYERSLELQRALGNEVGAAATLDALGIVALMQGDPVTAMGRHEESLEIGRRLGDRAGIATTSMYLANVAEIRGDLERARTCLSESLSIQRELGDRWGMAGSQNSLGRLAQRQGEFVVAEERYEEALELFRKLGDRRNVAATLTNLGTLAEKQADPDRARSLYAESLEIFGALDERPAIANLLLIFGQLASEHEEADRAAALMGAADAAREASGTTLSDEYRGSLEKREEVLRATLGEAGFDAAWQSGRALSREDAIALALKS